MNGARVLKHWNFKQIDCENSVDRQHMEDIAHFLKLINNEKV